MDGWIGAVPVPSWASRAALSPDSCVAFSLGLNVPGAPPKGRTPEFSCDSRVASPTRSASSEGTGWPGLGGRVPFSLWTMTDDATISVDERRDHLFRLAAVEPHDLTATVTATSANYGERWRTSADETGQPEIRRGRWRTSANGDGRVESGLENH